MENFIAILSKIGFDWQVALANFVNFLIIFLILKKFAFGPISKAISLRQKKIDEGIENAKKAETDLLMAENIRNEKIKEAKLEANTIIGNAQKRGDEIITLSEKEGQDKKSSIIKEGEIEAKGQKEKMKKEIESETANLVVSSLEKVLRENFDEGKQKDYIKKVLAN